MRLLALAITAVLAALALPAAAEAASSATSSNWGGYAITPKKPGARLEHVAATWVVAQGSCDSGGRGYSATWVGLGGFRSDSRALEQTGTEFDCRSSGKPVYSAWYELVPDAGHTIAMTVRPGDTIDASVTVIGKRVTLLLSNRTRDRTFRRSFTMRSPDTTSAEWIVEAPSHCGSSGRFCRPLPISNFGTQSFTRAYAISARGHRGGITDSSWRVTKITLDQASSDARFASESSAGGATPSALTDDGTSFSVTYTQHAHPGSSEPTQQFPGGPDAGFPPPGP